MREFERSSVEILVSCLDMIFTVAKEVLYQCGNLSVQWYDKSTFSLEREKLEGPGTFVIFLVETCVLVDGKCPFSV